MPITRWLKWTVVLAVCFLPAIATALTLDNFSDELPPNPCLPLSNQRLVFTGLFCDGVTCPPAPLVSCGSREVAQTGLPGVIAGTRRQVGMFNWMDEPANARVEAGDHRLRVVFGGTSESGVALDYGTPGESLPSPGALNLNLVTLGATGVQLVMDGDISAQHPLLVAIVLLSDATESPRPSAIAFQVVQQPGIVSIPIASFVPSLGFSMGDVDDISIWISNCLDYYDGCDSATYDPVEFTLGPIEIVTSPTVARPTSWGRLKQIYR